MPRIPQYEEQVGLKATEISARQSAGEAREAGLAIGGLGRAVGVFAQQWKQQAELQRRKAEDEEAAAWVMQQTSDLQRSQHERYVKDQEAMPEDGKGFATNFMTGLDNDIKSRLDQAPNEKAKQLFQQRSLEIGNRFANSSFDTETNARRNYAVKNVGQSVDNYVAAAVQGADPFELQDKLTQDHEAMRNMLPPGVADELVKKGRQGIALAALRREAEQSPQATYDRTGRYLKFGPEQKIEDPIKAAARAKSDGLLADLSTEQVLSLRNGAEVELKRQDAERKAAAREAELRAREGQMLARIELQDRLSANTASIAETGVPVPGVTEEAFKSAYGKDWQAQWERHKNTVGRASTIFEARTGLVDLSNDDIMQRVNLTKPTPGSVNFNDEKAAHDIVTREAANILKARTEDPIKFALQNSPTVKEAATQLQQTPNDPGVFNNYAKALMAAQERYGIQARDRRLLNDDQATSIVNQIQDAKPGKQGEVIDGLVAQYGGYWPAVHKEIVTHGKLKEDVQPLTWLDRPQQAQARKAYGEALAEGEAVTKEALGADKVKVINDGLDDAVLEIGDTLRAAPNGGKLTSQLKQTIKLIAYNYAKTMDPKDALDRAQAEVVGAGYTITNGYRVPKQYDADAVSQMTEDYLFKLTPADLDVPGAAANDPIYTDKQKAVFDEVKSKTKWITNGDETGLILIHADGRKYGEPVLLKNKKMAQIRFSDIGRFKEIDGERKQYAAERMGQ